MSRGRTSGLEEGDNRSELAELIAAGATRRDMAEFFGVHPDTITNWRKDRIVQQQVGDLNRIRANRIVARIDAAIEKRLDDAEEKLDVDELIKIRKELAPRVKTITEGDKTRVTEDAWKAADDEGLEDVPIPDGKPA